jgi:phage major head subunit gpT-like protein
MALDTAKAIAASRALTAKFNREASAVQTFYPSICTVTPSDGADEQYGILGAMPSIREYLGDRVYNKLRGATYTLANKEWEGSLEIEKKDVADDRLGLYDGALTTLAQRAARHPDKLLMSAIVNGESTACFDGQFFFDTDHSWGNSGSQDNDLTYAAATGTTPTIDEFLGSYEAARSAMMGFKDDSGEPLHEDVITGLNSGMQFVALVPRALETIAKKAFNQILNNSGGTNVVLDTPAVAMSTHLSSAAKWYLLRVDVPLRPFIFQPRESLAANVQGAEDMNMKQLQMGTYARYNIGYGAWWNAVLTTFT